MRTPFLSREEFESANKNGMKPDAIFPVMNYDFCKYIWDNSPLIAHLDESLQDYINK